MIHACVVVLIHLHFVLLNGGIAVSSTDIRCYSGSPARK